MLYETCKTNSPALHSIRIPKEKEPPPSSCKDLHPNQKQASYPRPWTLPSKPKPNSPLLTPGHHHEQRATVNSLTSGPKGKERCSHLHVHQGPKRIRLNVRPNQRPRSKDSRMGFENASAPNTNKRATRLCG